MIEVKNLVKRYGSHLAVDHLNFTVESGQIYGFLGPNGAGKSTTIKAITDVEPLDAGSIKFEGRETKEFLKKFKGELGIVPQEIAVYDDISAYQNVLFFCSLYGFRGKDLKARAKEALEFVGLWEKRKELPVKFSGGMKRRLNIACSIAHSPKLLIMDEPTVGIDPQSRNHIMNSIRKLNGRGTTVIYVSHYMEEIEALCNKVIVADQGKIIDQGEKEEFKKRYELRGLHTLEEIFLYLTGSELRDEEA